jgi:hypothetical protein
MRGDDKSEGGIEVVPTMSRDSGPEKRVVETG